MLNSITIENFKSIKKLELELGRINVFIGENGAGKSNILEAIVFAGAALADKLDNEFLASRGIRVTSQELMKSAFPMENAKDFTVVNNSPIAISACENKNEFNLKICSEGKPYPQWLVKDLIVNGEGIVSRARKKELIKKLGIANLVGGEVKKTEDETLDELLKLISKYSVKSELLERFIIFSPENSALRAFEKEGQILPLGINGEGLFKLIKVISDNNPELLESVSYQLKVLGWFSGFNLKKGSLDHSDLLEIEDRYLSDEVKVLLDQRSVNEGFLFLLFYFVLFSSELTPSFFAIDNIDASLNPKLCQKLMLELNKLAVAHEKQAILTTHNPAILDGLDLNDDNQRLFVVSRREDGSTRVRRIKKPKAKDGQIVRLSEMFMRGTLGGLPEGF